MHANPLSRECHKSVDAEVKLGAEIISDWELSVVNYSYAADMFPLMSAGAI